MSGSAFAVTHHAFSSGAGRTSDGNGSHASTLKSPSYTKSVSWQHYQILITLKVYIFYASHQLKRCNVLMTICNRYTFWPGVRRYFSVGVFTGSVVDYMKFSTFAVSLPFSPAFRHYRRYWISFSPLGFSGQGVVCYATFFCPPCRYAVFPDGVDFVWLCRLSFDGSDPAGDH